MEKQKLFAFIKETEKLQLKVAVLLREPFGGYANGYVAIPPEHPCYGKDYDDIDVEVHGGLTFGEFVKPLREEGWIYQYSEILNSNSIDDIPSDYYVVGFDTLHVGDNESNCDREYCIKETMSLMAQLEKMYND